MKVFEEAGIDCDLVVGSSVGSLIGAFWAAGYSTAQIAEVASSGGPLTLFDISPFADWGWIHGQRLQDYVNDQLGTPLLEKLERRLIVVASHYLQSEKGVPRDGSPFSFLEQGYAGVTGSRKTAQPIPNCHRTSCAFQAEKVDVVFPTGRIREDIREGYVWITVCQIQYYRRPCRYAATRAASSSLRSWTTVCIIVPESGRSLVW